MKRPLSPNEEAWARHLIGHGTTDTAPPSVAQRLRWLNFLDSAFAGDRCGCGTCPSIELVGDDGTAPRGASCHVLQGGTADLLALLHVVDDRPAYLEGAPRPGLVMTDFPPVDTSGA
ncbi:hypothetical protein SAMN02745244_00130 [Tessaracoccus bendigoensis DSM 12906]|uniref:Uncharacterized protein n=1 Tax=Tessaracoccus bendigoensis DSM 12906 TaxID=1123357 RepID=A0A1M6ABA5_9ACTN|nr:hypothetical protein [Tessaracoccus bendigoensis]SHI33707.1 hypothetical protein SAMN02745244_00130 [Tessaracoccus bendigoensis DSM 12906]